MRRSTTPSCATTGAFAPATAAAHSRYVSDLVCLGSSVGSAVAALVGIAGGLLPCKSMVSYPSIASEMNVYVVQ